MKQYTKRLHNGEDLKKEIENFAEEKNISAGCILSLVGGLSKTVLKTPRKPGEMSQHVIEKDVEIVSGTGTVSKHGHHIHLAVTDKDGKTVGGHLDYGCIVRVTTELVILSFNDVVYTREDDPETGFKELTVKEKLS
jgi:uncharacterized protein